MRPETLPIGTATTCLADDYFFGGLTAPLRPIDALPLLAPYVKPIPSVVVSVPVASAGGANSTPMAHLPLGASECPEQVLLAIVKEPGSVPPCDAVPRFTGTVPGFDSVRLLGLPIVPGACVGSEADEGADSATAMPSPINVTAGEVPL